MRKQIVLFIGALMAAGRLFAATVPSSVPEKIGTTAELQAKIQAHISQPRFAAAMWGIKIVSLDTGKTLFETNAGKLFSPASNSKLFTTALGLDRLGPDYRIKTSLYSEAKPDASGKLAGDLIVYGRGDPTINSRLHGSNIFQAFDPLINALTNAGVKSIEGNLIGDESFFRGPPYGSGWAWDDLEYYYGAELSALTIEDNALNLLVKPAERLGEPCRVTTSPATSFVTISNRTMTVAAEKKRTIHFFRPIGGNIIYVSGEMPLGDGGFKDEIGVHHPAEMFVSFFREALARRNISVSGQSRTVQWLDREEEPIDFKKLNELGFVESLPMRDIAREIQKPSQNLYTDLLLSQLGEKTRTAATPPDKTSEDLGVTALEAFVAGIGIKKGEFQFEEGSGLSRNNLVTPNAIVMLLQFMERHRSASIFRESLPIAGVDGTLRNRMKNTAAQGNVRAKTGTLRWANSISGHVTTAGNERLLFSILLNRYAPPPGYTSRGDIDVLPVWLAEFSGRSQELNAVETPVSDERVVDILREIEKNYSQRSEIFEVRTSHRNPQLAVNGVVETPAAKQEILTALSPLFGQVSGDIEVLRETPDAEPRWGLVRVSVGNVRKQLGHHAELGTQVLMGAVVKVWKQDKEWLFVQTAENYFGWITASSIMLGDRQLADDWSAAKKIIVTEMEGRIWEKADPNSLPVCDAVAGMLLKKIRKTGDWLKVELPDGRAGFLKSVAAVDFEAWKKKVRATPETIERTAKTFFGLPYLWGGTSTKAVDCSGFTKSVYSLNGVQLSRDAWQQAGQGTEIEPGKNFENLRKGDLLFFAENAGAKKPVVTHVAIYLQDQTFIHSSGMVRLNSFDPASPLFDAHRRKTFVGARRIL